MTSIIERWFEAGDSGDLDLFGELLHPDVVVHAPLGLSTRGVEAERDVWRAVRHAVPGLRHEIQEVVAEGSSVAARVVVTGTFAGSLGGLRPTGRPFRIEQMVLVHVADEMSAEAWEVADLSPLWEGRDDATTERA